MRKHITAVFALLALLAFAPPASAQVTTMGPANCLICNPDCPFQDEHPDFLYSLGLWDAFWTHGSCFAETCEDMHPRCSTQASAEDLERQDRINEILNTMEGDERVVALVDEFPEHIHLTAGGEALEVLGAACDEAKMVGRLHVTVRQVGGGDCRQVELPGIELKALTRRELARGGPRLRRSRGLSV
jgi:hypothetical protein